MPAKTPNRRVPEVKKAKSIRPGDSDPSKPRSQSPEAQNPRVPELPGAQEPRIAGRKLPQEEIPSTTGSRKRSLGTPRSSGEEPKSPRRTQAQKQS